MSSLQVPTGSPRPSPTNRLHLVQAEAEIYRMPCCSRGKPAKEHGLSGTVGRPVTSHLRPLGGQYPCRPNFLGDTTGLGGAIGNSWSDTTTKSLKFIGQWFPCSLPVGFRLQLSSWCICGGVVAARNTNIQLFQNMELGSSSRTLILIIAPKAVRFWLDHVVFCFFQSLCCVCPVCLYMCVCVGETVHLVCSTFK